MALPSTIPQEMAAPVPSPQMQTPSRSRGARFWWLPLSALVLVGLLAFGMVVLPSDIRVTVSAMATLAGMVTADMCCVVVLAKKRKVLGRREKWAWRCIAIGLFFYVVGNVIIGVISTSVQNSTAIVTPADAFIIPSYPLLLAGAALMPPINPSWSRQLRSIVDALIVVGAFLGIALVVLIVPRYGRQDAADYIYILYPVLDTVGVIVFGSLLIRGKQRPYSAVVFWLFLGMACLAAADALFNYVTLPIRAGGAGYYADQAASSVFIAPLYLAAPLAFCMAALQLLVRGEEPGPGWGWLERLTTRFSSVKTTNLREQLVVLFLPVAILGSLLIYVNLHPQAIRIPLLALILLTLVVVVFIIIRQLLTTRDLVDAHQAREQAEQLDALKDQFITSINHELRTPFMVLENFLENITDLESLRASPQQRDVLLQDAVWAHEVMKMLLFNLNAQARREPITHAIRGADLVRAAQVCVQVVQALQQESQANEQLVALLKYANEASTTLSGIINNILDIRRYDQASMKFDPQVVSVLQTVRNAVLVNQSQNQISARELEQALQSGRSVFLVSYQGQRRISARIAPRLSIWGEATYFYEIVNNLITNAMKYSPDNAHIQISAALVSSKGKQAGTGGRAGETMVELVVRDNGFGIPEDKLKTIFSRFVRLPRDLASTRQGTGLGLYLCHVFAEAMGGLIWAESKGENLGSAFHVRLPAPPPSVLQTHERQSSRQRTAATQPAMRPSGMEQRRQG